MADLGNVLSAATQYGNDREAEGRAEERETHAAEVAELNARILAAEAALRDHLALPAPAGHAAPEPEPTQQVFGTSYGGADESKNRGRSDVARLFYNGPSLPNTPLDDPDFVKAYNEGNRAFAVSWKTENDAEVQDFLDSFPKNATVYGSFHHEVENDVPSGDARAPYLANFKRVTERHYAVMARNNVIPIQIFMQYTLTASSGRNLMDYFVPGAKGVCYDTYLNPKKGKDNPEAMVDRMVQANANLPGVEFSGLTEFAVNNNNSEQVCFDLVKRMRAKLDKTPAMRINTYWPSGPDFVFQSDRIADAWFEG